MKKFLAKVGYWFLDILKLSLVVLLTFSVISGGWQYADVDGKEMRAWTIRLPGFEEYIDWEHGETEVRRVFSIKAKYRVGPWIEPEWVDTPDLGDAEDEHAEP